jgi:Rrf2 family iron-sulfur cluster assembly transcriptional regulator
LLTASEETSMRMSTKSRFAVQAMTDLALRERAGPVALAQIATRQGVSLSYLEQLFSRLRRAGLVDSTRGPGGGYSLGRSAADISAADPAASTSSMRSRTGRAHAADARALVRPDTVLLRHRATVPLGLLVDEQFAKGTTVDEPAPAPDCPVGARLRATRRTRHSRSTVVRGRN